MLSFVFLVMTVVILFATVGVIVDLNRQKERFVGFICIVIASVCILVWSATFVLYMAEPIPSSALSLYKARMLGLTGFVPFYFLFTLYFNNKNFAPKKGFLSLIFIIPAITLFATLTNGMHGLIYKELSMINMLPYKELKIEFGAIKLVFWGYVVFTEITTLTMFLMKFRNVAAIYKTRIALFLIATAVSIASLYSAYKLKSTTIDLYLLGCAVKNMISYWALIRYDTSDFMILAKDTVFERISCVALVLDNDRKIIDSNPLAKELFGSADIELNGIKYETVMERWLKAKYGTIDSTDDGLVMCFRAANNVFYYSITESSIKDKKNRPVGIFVEMRDVTRQQELLRELFHLVNHDQLTGIYNRRYFEKMCAEFDNPNYYPLGVISGDLNKLKSTNDTYGHAAGDRLIVLIAEILKRSAPKNAIVSRQGGDEFFILLPLTSEVNIQHLMEKIHENCKGVYEEPFGSPSISLGYALKSKPEENLEHIMSVADMRMYQDKQVRHQRMGTPQRA